MKLQPWGATCLTPCRQQNICVCVCVCVCGVCVCVWWCVCGVCVCVCGARVCKKKKRGAYGVGVCVCRGGGGGIPTILLLQLTI